VESNKRRVSTRQQIQADTWVKATWDDFVAIMDDPQYEEGRGYFDHGYMRVEMAPLGSGHGRQNTVVSQLVGLFGALQNRRVAGFTNCASTKLGSGAVSVMLLSTLAIASNCFTG
jgi:hypothetical protein